MAVIRPVVWLAGLGAVVLLVAACGGRGAAPSVTRQVAPIRALPVVACKTEDAVYSAGFVIPHDLPYTEPLPVGLSQTAAATLAWYQGNTKRQPGLKVLAPRGWRCSALVAVDGGWNMTVSKPHTKQAVQIGAAYNGPGAAAACVYFPSAASASPEPSACTAPQKTTIAFKSDHLASITTSVSSRLRSVGFAYWYPELQNTFETASCALPGSERPTCATILAEAQKRVGEQLAAFVAKYGSATSNPATTTAAGSPQQLAATVTGRNGLCLADVTTSSAGLQRPEASDTFDLRKPGNGLTEGDVLAVPSAVQAGPGGCSIVLSFDVGTGLGFYVIVDEMAGVSWGPFDSRNLPAEGWALTLTYS